MNEAVRQTWYVSRRVDAPTFVVADLVRWLLADGPITVEADGAALTVAPTGADGLVWPSHHAVTRVARGQLRRSGRLGRLAPRVGVDLEVEAWSRDACELALRPSGRRIPADAVAYGRLAAVTLERVRDVVVRLLCSPEEPAPMQVLRRAS